jgi:hypothetical protein
MVYKSSIQYPHSISVVGKTTIPPQSPERFTKGTGNAFNVWLGKNYIDNESLNLGISLLHLEKDAWEEQVKTLGVEHSYEKCLNCLELFEGQTIEVIVGM